MISVARIYFGFHISAPVDFEKSLCYTLWEKLLKIDRKLLVLGCSVFSVDRHPNGIEILKWSFTSKINL